MAELLKDLRMCDKSIEFWLDCKLYVVGTREIELSHFHTRRGLLLAEIKDHRMHWQYK